MAAAEVVLPTPPLPDVTTMTLSQIHPPRAGARCPPRAGSGQRVDHQPLALERDAGTSPLMLRVDLLADQVHARRSTAARPRAGRRRSARPRRPRCRRRPGRAGRRRRGCGRTAASSAPALTVAMHHRDRRRRTICWPPRTGSRDHRGRPAARRPPRRRSLARCAPAGGDSGAAARRAAGAEHGEPGGHRGLVPRRRCRSGCRPASAGAGAAARPAGSRSSGGWPAIGADVEHQRRVAEEIRRVRDLVDQQRDEVRIVRREQPQRQHRLQRAAHLERSLAARQPALSLRRLLPPDHSALGHARRDTAPAVIGPRDDHNMLWFGASRSRVCGSQALLAIFARKASGDIAPARLSPRRLAPPAPGAPCAGLRSLLGVPSGGGGNRPKLTFIGWKVSADGAAGDVGQQGAVRGLGRRRHEAPRRRPRRRRTGRPAGPTAALST